MFNHEYKINNVRVFLNTQRRHFFNVGYNAVITTSQLMNTASKNAVAYVNENADSFIHNLFKTFVIGQSFAVYFDQSIGFPLMTSPSFVLPKSFTHDDTQQPNIIIGTNKEEAIFKKKNFHKTDKNEEVAFYIYTLKGSNNAQYNTEYYFSGENNTLLRNYPHLKITPEEEEAFDNNIKSDFFNPRLVIHQPFPYPYTPELMEREYKRSYAIGYFFNLRTYIPLVGSSPSAIQSIISIGKLNSKLYGNSYYSFVVLAKGKIGVIQSTKKSDGTYRHRFIRYLDYNAFKLNNNEGVGAVSCCVFIYKDDLYVIFSAIDNMFNSPIDALGNAISKAMMLDDKDFQKNTFAKGGNYVVYKIGKYEYVTSIDATIYTQDDASLDFNGFPLAFKNQMRIGFDISLPISAVPTDIWYKSNFAITVQRNLRNYNIQFDNVGNAYDYLHNVNYVLRMFAINEDNEFVEVQNTKGGRIFLVIEGYKENPYVLNGFDMIALNKQPVAYDVYYSNEYGEFDTRFIRSITINRGHYNDNNTCLIEFAIDKRHPAWLNRYEQMLNSNVISVDIYVNNRLIFSGVTPIDNFKEHDIDIINKIETLKVNFEEDWIRRLKENSVILPENLSVHGSHSRALKYIFKTKIGINENDLLFADDNIPLPLTTELSQESEYTMIMGRDFYSYVDNIVSNFSGWTLYRNYALNADNANNIKLVYKPKPLFPDASLVRCVFYGNQNDYTSSNETHKAKIVGGIKIDSKRPFATALAIIRPVYNDVKSIISDVLTRWEIVNDSAQPDYIGFPIIHYILYPMMYDLNGDKNNVDIFKREAAIRYLYGHRTASFRANFVPHLHYYSQVYIEDVGYGVIKNMTVNISSEGVFCDYVVTLETGGIMYQW